MRNRYRIVRDNHCGYEVQVKKWWFPVWVQVWSNGITNTSASVEDAKKVIANHKKPVVYVD